MGLNSEPVSGCSTGVSSVKSVESAPTGKNMELRNTPHYIPNRPVSDIDIIVVYQTEKKFMDRLEELYMKWNLPKAVDIIAYTPDEFTDMMKDNFFLKQAVKEGIIIYERT